MPRVNQNHESDPKRIDYFRGSPYRQYGSGFGAAIKAGLKGFVITMVKRYGIPVVKSFLQQAAPEVINISDGSTKPKAAMRNAVKKTIRKRWRGTRRQNYETCPVTSIKHKKVLLSEKANNVKED